MIVGIFHYSDIISEPAGYIIPIHFAVLDGTSPTGHSSRAVVIQRQWFFLNTGNIEG